MSQMFPPRARGVNRVAGYNLGVRRPSAVASVIVACACLGAALRLWGIGFGLPWVIAHPDESRIARTSLDFFSGSFDPGFFNYPTLFMYLNGAAYLAYCGAQNATRHFESIGACVASWASSYEPFFLIPRIISALAGTAAVVLAFFIGRRTADRWTGSVSAFYVAVCFLHVRDSHFGVTDATMTTLLLLALAALMRAHDVPSVRRFALAGLLAGFAASTKYNAVLLGLPLLASAWLHWRDHGATVGRLDWRIPVFAAAMTAGFLVGTPYALVEPALFWRDVAGEAAHLSSGHAVFLGIGWSYHARVTLRYGLTMPLWLAGLAGAGLLLFRRPRAAALFLAFPVAYYVLAGRGHTVFARYMVPVLPFLCVTAAYMTVWVARGVASRAGERAFVPTVVAVALLLGGPSFYKTVQMDRILARRDTRGLAAEWIAGHVPNGASMYITGSRVGHPDLWRKGAPPPWPIWRYDEQRRGFVTPSGPTDAWPDWIVMQESPLVAYSSVPTDVRSELPRYNLRQSFVGLAMSVPHVFDQQDAFFLPLDGFEKVARPGPNLYMYEIRR